MTSLSPLNAREFIWAATVQPIVYPTFEEFAAVWARSTPEEREELARAFRAWHDAWSGLRHSEGRQA